MADVLRNRLVWSPRRLLLLMALACFFSGTGPPGLAMAGDRALLVGVGKYRNPRANLSGIDLDIRMMKGVANLMGFSDSQIKVIENERATASNVEGAIHEWLVKGAGSGDRVLFYYSGHGSQVPDRSGDESDRSDETLVLHDVRVVQESGRKTLKGVLVDDRFHELLGMMKSRNILVLLDCCHSGTATKGLSLETRSIQVDRAMVKFFYYEGMPEAAWTKGNFVARRRTGGGPSPVAAEGRYVAVTACRDDEKSLATAQGSIFTLGLRAAIREAAGSGGSLTPEGLQNRAAKFVRRQVSSPSKLFHPQISGSKNLRRKPIRLASSPGSGHGQVWRQLEELVRKRSADVGVSLNKRCFVLGDAMTMTIRVPQEGYLNVVNVGPDDDPTVLYPNRFHKDNRVSAGRVTIPTKKMGFELVASRPAGPSLVVAVVTKKAVNLFKDGFRDADAVFASLSPKGMRSFTVVGKTQKWLAAGKAETVVRDSGGCR